MTQEEKELLLVDLCARLPYDVIVVDHYGFVVLFTWKQMKDFEDGYISKPYLRPMSSMTTDEEYEYHQIRRRNSNKSLSLMDCDDHLQQLLFPIIVGTETIDWLNAHHFDYRGLIPKGLAIEVKKENNPYK